VKRGWGTQEKIFCSSLNVVEATLYRFNVFMRGFNYSFGTKCNEYVYLVKLKNLRWIKKYLRIWWSIKSRLAFRKKVYLLKHS